MTHPPSEYFNIPFCRGQNGNMKKFKAFGCLPRGEKRHSGWTLKEKRRQVHGGLFKKCGEKSSGLEVRTLGSDPSFVTHSLGDRA